jgi:hypothetical protein
MKSICDYVNRSAPTVLKWIRVDGFPAGRICGGIWESDTDLVDKWREKKVVDCYLKGKNPRNFKKRP